MIGAGIMGSGIAQLAAMHDHAVRLHDLDDAAIGTGLASIDRSLARFERKDRLGGVGPAAVRSRITATTDLAEAVQGAEVVIEAVSERLELKRQVFAEVRAHAPSEALLGTNTSQLSITAIATALGDDADRLVGMHFFNPPVVMRLCELVRGVRTSDAMLERARRFAETLDKTVVVCRKDSPGFITSRAYAMLRLECLRMLDEGVASAEDIDTAMKLGFNLPMGPLELGDFNGLDTYLHAVEGLADAYGERFRPTVGLRNMVAAGLLGRKSGEGFYRYDGEGNRLGGSPT